jgi:hypothetical protein
LLSCQSRSVEAMRPSTAQALGISAVTTPIVKIIPGH